MGFVFGAIVGAAIASPAKEVPRAVEEQIQRDEKSVPHMPSQEGMPSEAMPVQQAYNPVDKNAENYQSH